MHIPQCFAALPFLPVTLSGELEGVTSMSHDVVVRFSDEEAAALRDHKKHTDLPMSAFIRRAVRNELRRPVIDAEPTPEQRRSVSPAPVLFTPRKAED
jgi:hypothetical protein